MAHYGGGRSSPPPRVHRPRAPIMSAPPPQTAPLAPLRPSSQQQQQQQPPVSLVAPRPENERAANEYVETPFRPPAAAVAVVAPPPPPPQPPRTARPHRLPVPPPPLPPVTKQPPGSGAAAASFSKHVKDPSDCARPSIMCPECSRCRCESCQQPRPLPQRWVCDNTCLLSADAVIDYASCLCCVKGLFYHCSDDADGGAGDDSCADAPCGCAPERRKARWGCLAALSFVLPCLWLYWPLRGCKHAVEACYARHSRTGCRCRPPPPSRRLASPEKRLLDATTMPDF